MPTPVTTARQCLTPEAANALDEAVNVAKRRGHGQTTSLHAISALLSLPSSPLRDACSRARNSSYSSRLQFKALELCLSVSLDRVPSSGHPGSSNQCADPPVSNSLMAAIKRSQANQRRQPENFHFYQQQQSQLSSSSSSSMSGFKVELRNLILSILDDPVVSRVFREAGFWSSEIKLGILRPVPQLFRVPRLKPPPPPMFMCNSKLGSDPGLNGFGLPLGCYTGLMGGEEGWRRIGEVLGRERGRNSNPVLVGACGLDVLERFCEVVEKRKGRSFSLLEVSGLRLIGLGSEVRRFVSGRGEKGCLDLRFQEVGKLVSEESLCLGVVLNVGDLKVFVKEETEGEEVKEESLGYVVGELTGLLKLQGGKRVWIIGAVERYETCLKLVARFPSIAKDWDLQLLLITSFRSSGFPTESYPRSSLMESFVPFGGFFSTPSDFYGPLSSSYHHPPRCNVCNEKCEQEVLAASKGEVSTSVADQYQSCLPSWLQMAELGTKNGPNGKARDNGVLLSAKVASLQKKWDDICWRLHHVEPPGSNVYTSHFPTIVGFQLVEDKKEDGEHCVSNNLNALPSANRCANADSSIPVDSPTISSKPSRLPFPVVPEVKTDSSKQLGMSSKKEDIDSCSLRSPSIISTSSKGDASQASPTHMTSVTTDLGLGINSMTNATEMKTPVKLNQNQRERLSVPSHNSPDADFVNGSFSDHLAQSSSSSSPYLGGYFDLRNFKKLFKALTERVGWQDEGIRDICQTMACCWTKNEKHQGASLRRGIWLHFLGPDKCGKRKIAAAIAKKTCGRGENIFCADFGCQDHMVYRSIPLDNQGMNCYDVTSRGKTLVDYIVSELRKKPSSVVFLENVDRADVQTQNTLSRAIHTGKFSDSIGREVGINNAIFVTTSTFSEDEILSSRKDLSSYSEDRILRAKGWPLQLLIEQAVGSSGSMFLSKRKLDYTNQNRSHHELPEAVKRVHSTSPRILDLNLPAEENHVDGSKEGSSDGDSISDSSRAWLQEYFDQVDRIISFKAFDFDALAQRILNEINEAFHKIVGPEPLLDIDEKVMEQLLAAAYLSETNLVEDWVGQVLSWSFVQAMKKHNLGSHTVIRLVTCGGCSVQEPEPGVYLPRKIIIN